MTESDLPLQARVDLWRQKVIAGTITDEELKEAVRVLRADRQSAAIAGQRKRAAKGPVKTGEELLDELDSLS